LVVEAILERWRSVPPKSLTAQAGTSSVSPISQNHMALVEALSEIARNLIVPSTNLLKQKIKQENVIDVAALLAGHNIVLIALRGGLLEKPYSTLDNDPDWFKNQLYNPICDKVKSKEEQDLVMKIVNHAESLGIIRNAEVFRQSIVINENIERRIQTIGSVIVDLYQRINKVDAGFRDVARHTKSMSLALKQFHQAYQAKQSIDCVSSLLHLVISAVPFTATAIEKPVGMGFELLLTGVKKVANQETDEITDVDLTDLRVTQWIISESYQKCLPEHVRELFANDAQQTFGGMLELEDAVYEMMNDKSVTPLNITRRRNNVAQDSLHALSASKPVFFPLVTGSKRKFSSPLVKIEEGSFPPSGFPRNFGATDWIPQYLTYLSRFGGSDLSFEDVIPLTSGAITDKVVSDGWTVLIWAAALGRENILKVLLDKDTNTNDRTNDGCTALHKAAQYGYENIVKLLLQKDADIDSKNGNQETALHLAARSGKENVVTLLLNLRAKVNEKNNRGETALLEAAKFGYENMVKMLVDKGAKIDEKTNDKCTALHWAAENGYENIVRFLLEQQAAVNIKNDCEETALHRAASRGNENIVTLLLGKGADIHDKNSRGKTALYMAIENGHENVVNLLLKNGADIHATTNDGNTALHKAAEKGYENIVKVLLEKGADVHATNHYHKCTPLHWAAGNGYEKIVEMLLEKGAPIDDKDDEGWTALHYASHWGKENVVTLLLCNGAEANARTNKSETPLDLALSNGKSAIEYIINNELTQAPQQPDAQVGGNTAGPVLLDNQTLLDILIEISCNKVPLSTNLLKQKIKLENVVDVTALLAGHNIVLIALRSGLLERPYSTLNGDQDWFKRKLYRPICDRVKSEEEKELAIEALNHAELLGIIHNADDIRQSIVINDKIERRIQTIGTVIADIYRRINKVEVDLKDVTEHCKFVGAWLKQLHEAYHKGKKLGCVSGLLPLVVSAIALSATAVGETAETRFKQLLMELKQVANQTTDEFTVVDLTDFRVGQWIVSENFQKSLPNDKRILFEKEALLIFDEMSDLENCIDHMMKQCNVKPLSITRRNMTRAALSLYTRSMTESVTQPVTEPVLERVTESVTEYENVGSKRRERSPAANEPKRPALARPSDQSFMVREWKDEYENCLARLGGSDLSLEDAASLASNVSGRDEETCKSVLLEQDPNNTGRFNRMRFVLAMEKLTRN